jgi:multidrug efflux pump subunit AcrB
MFVVGRDFFPYVDSGQMRLHVRTPECTRIEETEHIFGQVDREIRRLIPANEIAEILDNIGLPNSGINLAFGDNSTIASSDADILISLNPTTKSKGTEEYTRILRDDLRGRFPQETFFFQAANITNQILNFGLPMPIDVQIVGRNANQNYQLAREIRDKVAVDSRRRRCIRPTGTVKTRHSAGTVAQDRIGTYATGLSTNFLVMQYQSFVAQARSTEVAAATSM